MSDAPQPAEQPQWKLTRINSKGVAEVVFITSETTRIGRELDNEIPLDDLQVSRYHTQITLQGDYLIVEDLGSANGTTVNGALLSAPAIVHTGDTIAVASYSFEVQGPPRIVSRSRLKTEDSAPVVPIAPIAPAAAPPQPVETSRRVWPWLLLVAGLVLALIIVLGGVLVGQRLFFNIKPPPTQVSVNLTPTPLPIDIIINQAPPGNSQIPVNQSVTIQATAFDSAGITRVELWVNGRLIETVNSPLAQNAQSMTVTFQWTADEAGDYVVELRSYNEAGLSTVTEVTTLTALSVTGTPAPAPISMITPVSPTVLPPTATPTATPLPAATSTPTVVPAANASPTAAVAMLQVNIPLLNVRAGPSTQYELSGRLDSSVKVKITGQSGGLQAGWWQIPFAAAPNGLGWVSANPAFVTVVNADNVPVISGPPLPTAVTLAATVTGTSTPRPVATITPTPTPQVTVIRPPDGKMLLIVSNRSLGNYPARLTLSGGKSVGGGREIDPPPGGEVQLVLEPDFYRAVWSASYNNFARGSDFTAVPGKVVVMWVVPEEGRTETEIYDELLISSEPPPTVESSVADGPPPGKALFVVSNRSLANEYAMLTIAGGNFGGGKELILNANTESQLELVPGNYRTIWTTPAGRGMNAGKEFAAVAGDIIYGRIIPENGEAYMQFPGQPEIQINN